MKQITKDNIDELMAQAISQKEELMMKKLIIQVKSTSTESVRVKLDRF